MSRIKEERFLSRLSEFASGRVGVSEFRDWLGQVLATEEFDLSSDHSGRISGKLSYALHCASHLDMATEPEDSRQDQERARRLAALLALIPDQMSSPGLILTLSHLAVGEPETIDRTRKHLASRVSRPAYETFLSRRPWPDQLKAVVKQLSRQELDEFVDALSRSNFGRIEELLDGKLTSESHGA